MKIIFCSDPHLGKSFQYKRNKNGVSERSIDLIKQMGEVTNYAIENDAEIIVVCGDLYDKYTINSNIKKYFRKNVFLPAIEEGIRVLIIGGNHDSHPQLNYGCDIESLNMATNCVVKRNPGTKTYKFKKEEERVGFVVLPYLTPVTLYDTYINKDNKYGNKGEIISPQIASEYVANKLIPAYLKRIDGCNRKIIIGHYHVIGTKVTNLPASFALREMEFNRAMLREHEIDLAVFGHIHIHQVIGDRIIVPGSTERIDFGERDEKKYFIDYDTVSNRWKPVELECRKMIQVDVDATSLSSDPNREIHQKIKDIDVKGALFKLAIKTTPRIKRKIDQIEIEKKLKDPFHSIIEYKLVDDEYNSIIDMTGIDLDPVACLGRFVESKYSGIHNQEWKDKVVSRTLSYMGKKRKE